MAEIKPIEKQVDELVRKLSVIKDREIDYAVARSLNRTLRAGRTEVAKEVRAKTKLPSKLIKSRMYEKRASAGDQTAALRMYTRPVPAISLPNVRDTGRLLRDKRGRFAGRKGRGVRARGGFHYPDSWIGRGKNGTRQVFSQATSTPFNASPLKVEREDIYHPFESVANRILQRQMRENFASRLQAELKYRLSKYTVK